LFFLFILILT